MNVKTKLKNTFLDDVYSFIEEAFEVSKIKHTEKQKTEFDNALRSRIENKEQSLVKNNMTIITRFFIAMGLTKYEAATYMGTDSSKLLTSMAFKDGLGDKNVSGGRYTKDMLKANEQYTSLRWTEEEFLEAKEVVPGLTKKAHLLMTTGKSEEEEAVEEEETELEVAV